MASYATVAQLRARLTQIPAGAAVDALLQECLDEATAMIDLELGFSLGAFPGAASALDVRAEGNTEYLEIPAHLVGSITAVAWVSGKATDYETTEAITDYAELADGRLYRGGGWWRREWYRITCKWGHGVASDAIEKVCWEKARDVWYSKDGSASANVAGIEGAGAVVTQRTWTDEQWRILQRTRGEHGEFGIA